MLAVNDAKMKEDAHEVRMELQNELIKLQRQYRLLEDDRKAYKDETEYTLKKQTNAINALLTEKTELMKDYNLVTQKWNHNYDKMNLQKLRSLLDEEDAVKKECSLESKKLKHLNKEVKQQVQKIEKGREGTGYFKEQELCKALIKHIRVLDNRLDQANIKFNSILAENSSFRQEIEFIAVQRARFSDLYKKLMKIYVQGVRARNKLVNISKSLYTVREEAEHRMNNLREKAERDLTHYNAELKDLLRIIDHDRKLRDFMTTKANELSEIYEQAVQGRRDKLLSANIRNLQSQVERYEDILEKLVKVSGYEDADAMVKKFVRIEDENFALFNYVNEQNIQWQQLENQIEEIKAEIELLSNFESSATSERKVILKELDARYQRVTGDVAEHDKLYKHDRKILEQAKKNIFNLFAKAGCNSQGISDLLGNSEITVENMVQFLSAVEQQTNLLIQVKLMLALKENNENDVAQLQTAWAKINTKVFKMPFFRPPSVTIDCHDTMLANHTLAGNHTPQPINENNQLKPKDENEVRMSASKSVLKLASTAGALGGLK